MYEYLISQYVKKISVNDIINFGIKNNIDVSTCDAKVLLHYLINNYKELISDNPNNILKEIKRKIDPQTYDKAYKLYLNYRNQYLNK